MLYCDHCKAQIHPPKPPVKEEGKPLPPPPPPPLLAKFQDSLGQVKEFHFCQEPCLRDFLTVRHTPAPASIAYVLDFP